MRLLIVIILFIYSIANAIGQTTSVGTILTQIEQSTDSLEKVHLYSEIANQLKTSDLNRAIYYTKNALTLANQINAPEACGSVNELMAQLFEKKNNLQPAINYYLISAKIYEGLDDKQKLASIYGSLGTLYYRDNYNLERSIEYNQKSLGFALLLNDKSAIAEAYNRIGRAFANQENLDEAEYYFRKAHEIWSILRDNNGLAIAINNLGEVARMRGNLAQALKLYNQSLEFNIAGNQIHQMGINYENIGLIHSMRKQTEQAFTFYNKSLELYTQNNDTEDRVALLILIGKEYLHINEYAKAEEAFLKAYEAASAYDHWDHLKESALGLSNSYEMQGSNEQALRFFKIFSQFNDSIHNKRKTEQIFDLQSRFRENIREKEYELKDNKIDLLESQQKVDELRFNILVLFLFALITTAIIILFRFRQTARRERIIRKKDAELHKTQQELMEIELKSKNNDLMNFALHLVQKNELLQQLKKDLKELSKTTELQSNKKFQELSRHVHKGMQLQKEIEDFQHKVDLTYAGFFQKLKIKFPSLTKNEERLCALLRMNLSTKEIAALNNISVKAVEMSRYRLRKKCGIENSEILSSFLEDI